MTSIKKFQQKADKKPSTAKLTPAKIRAALQIPRPEGAWPTGWF